VFDTTSIASSAIARRGAASEPPATADEPADGGNTSASSESSSEEKVASSLEWTDVFLPGATIGLGLGTRRLPVSLDIGVIGQRYERTSQGTTVTPLRAAFFAGVSLNIPLFDLR
jgi:hypothetical protein